MHIRVLKTWCGIEGMFVGGEIREVDEAVLEKIGNKKLGHKKRLHYEEVPPPWEAQKDETAVQVSELQKEIVAKESQFDEMKQCYDRLGEVIDDQAASIKKLDDAKIRSEQSLRQLAARYDKALVNAEKAPSEANTKQSAELEAALAAARRMAARAEIALRIAGLSPDLSEAKRELLALDADNLVNEVEALCAELYELRPDLKPKEDEDVPTEKTEAPDGPGPADGKDAADAKGQTGAAGQTAAVQE